jgi:acylphosphatase
MESIHLEVQGRVQGVGFRWYVVEMARELGLAGWVKNTADGNVELAAAGSREALDKLNAAVRAGPRGARIEAVRVLPAIPASDCESPFAIVR